MQFPISRQSYNSIYADSALIKARKLYGFQVVMGAFNALNEEVKSSASFSWGRICIGNLQHYLPGMIQRIQEQVRIAELH